MTTINTRLLAIQQIGLGRAQNSSFVALAGASITAATAASGFIGAGIGGNLIGTTYPNTIASFSGGVVAPANGFRTVFSSISPQRTPWLCNFYKIGTVDFTASGNAFTHDAATFPILKNNLFGSNQPITLWPILYITTATATTAPSFILETSLGGAGYVNASGSNIVGTKTFTLPAAATIAQGAYFLRLEDGDSGVQDITQLNMTASGTAGAATIWGAEPICTIAAPALSNVNAAHDGLLGCLDLANQTPGTATSGTATTFFGILGLANVLNGIYGNVISVRDT